jgi:TPR repeat protein
VAPCELAIHSANNSRLGELHAAGCPPILAPEHALAAKIFLKLAQAGHAHAQYFIGNMYADGRMCRLGYDEQSQVSAVEWYRKAADQGHTQAQYALGCCCECGIGITTDYKMAAKVMMSLRPLKSTFPNDVRFACPTVVRHGQSSRS